MRFVVSYTEGDGCTYSCQCDIPVEYDSAEQLLLDIEAGANRLLSETNASLSAYAASGTWKTIKLDEYKVVGENGSIVWVNHFIENGKFYAPSIYTVDEWFASGVRT